MLSHELIPMYGAENLNWKSLLLRIPGRFSRWRFVVLWARVVSILPCFGNDLLGYGSDDWRVHGVVGWRVGVDPCSADVAGR
jgi:hypothetical protein